LTWSAVPPAPSSILEELLQLQLVDGRKVDHMSLFGSKDCSDALAGACFSCIEGQRRKGSNIDMLANLRRNEEFRDD